MGTIPDEGLLYDYNVRRDEFHIYLLYSAQLWPLTAPLTMRGFDDASLSRCLHCTPQQLGFITGFRNVTTGEYTPKVTQPEGQLIIPFSMLTYGDRYELVLGHRENDGIETSSGYTAVAATRGASVPPPRAIYSADGRGAAFNGKLMVAQGQQILSRGLISGFVDDSQRTDGRASDRDETASQQQVTQLEVMMERINELEQQLSSLQQNHNEVGRKLGEAMHSTPAPSLAPPVSMPREPPPPMPQQSVMPPPPPLPATPAAHPAPMYPPQQQQPQQQQQQQQGMPPSPISVQHSVPPAALQYPRPSSPIVPASFHRRLAHTPDAVAMQQQAPPQQQQQPQQQTFHVSSQPIPMYPPAPAMGQFNQLPQQPQHLQQPQHPQQQMRSVTPPMGNSNGPPHPYAFPYSGAPQAPSSGKSRSQQAQPPIPPPPSYGYQVQQPQQGSAGVGQPQQQRSRSPRNGVPPPPFGYY